jgi:hypothetical protein
MRLHAIYAHKCATSTQRIPQTPYQATEFVVTMPARSRSSSYSRCAIPCTMRVAGSLCVLIWALCCSVLHGRSPKVYGAKVALH